MISESLLTWSAAALVTAAVVFAYWLRFRRRVAADRERKREAERLGIDQPTAQYPYIDPHHCIGCGACVAACPEGDVLGVVGGTAVVINGLRCVGHGRCEAACPVGAIEVGLGDLKSRRDVPRLSPGYESSVPGVFVVGELGGLALVRNAIAQGSEAGHEVVRRVQAHSFADDRDSSGFDPALADPGVLDVAIVGSGPAGLSAAAVCARAGLRHLVLEREQDLGGSLLHYPRRKMVLTQPVEIPGWGQLDQEEYQKEDLVKILTRMMADTGIRARYGAPVESIERASREPDAPFVLQARGEVEARFVILALGRRGTPRKLGIPGEELPKVLYRLIDAASYRDRDILVVGGGDSAAEAALGLSAQPGNRVTLSYRREKIVRVKHKNQQALDQAIAAGRIEPLFSSQPLEVAPDRVRLQVDDAGEVEIPNDDVFIFAGGVPPFGLLHELGVEFGGQG
jgi:thioredoxin reductase/ferredoxin